MPVLLPGQGSHLDKKDSKPALPDETCECVYERERKMIAFDHNPGWLGSNYGTNRDAHLQNSLAFITSYCFFQPDCWKQECLLFSRVSPFGFTSDAIGAVASTLHVTTG